MITSLLLLANVVILMLRVSPAAGSFPRPLSAAEEADALRRMAEGDPSARQELIERNLRLVAHVVKKYYASHEDQDDLISIGTIGLIKAVASFDGSKGTRLATYAARCVENAIHTQRNFGARKQKASFFFWNCNTKKTLHEF